MVDVDAVLFAPSMERHKMGPAIAAWYQYALQDDLQRNRCEGRGIRR